MRRRIGKRKKRCEWRKKIRRRIEKRRMDLSR
jgi:hypothetical protein